LNNDIAIKVENLSKVFPLRQPQEDENGNLVHEHWALKDVSFEIKKGESVGIIGPNGSGKSTLLKILAGVTKPTSGKITIKGKVASILDIGAGFHPELSGRENVFLNGQIHGFSKKEIEVKFDEIVAFSGIEKFIDEPVKNYSNGMYLRLAFSIMVHLDFDVYLLDEVLSVGDAEFRRKSQQRLYQLHSFQKKTIISVSHYMWEMAGVDVIFYVSKGSVNSTLSKDNVIKRYTGNKNQVDLMIDNPLFINKHQFTHTDLTNYIDEFEVYTEDVNRDKKRTFKSDENIMLSMRLKGIKKEFNFCFVLLDMFHNPIMEISPAMQNTHPSIGQNQLFSVTFPKRYFNSNNFSVDLVFFTENKVCFFQENVCSFSIVLEDSFINTVFSRSWGALKPFLNWEVKLLNNF